MFPRPFCLLVWFQLFCRVMCLTFRCDAFATRNRCFWVCIANLAVGLGVPFVWAGMPESMLQTIIFCIWETVSWFCNARQRTLHLQNGIKQEGEQGGTVLNLFGFFLEKCVFNINLGGAVMNHCIQESHKFRSS